MAAKRRKKAKKEEPRGYHGLMSKEHPEATDVWGVWWWHQDAWRWTMEDSRRRAIEWAEFVNKNALTAGAPKAYASKQRFFP